MIWRQYGYGMHFLHFPQTVSFMSQEIINYPFDPELDDDDSESSVSSDRVSETNISYVNGHNLPEDDEDKEDDLILGDEDEIDEADLAEDEIDVEVDDDVDAVVSDDDLVLDTEDDVLDDDEEEDDL
jgi:hypothetical protein